MNTEKNLLTPKLSQLLLNHLQAFINSIGQLSRAPLASFFTFIVIGIALALPMGFFVLLHNVQHASSNLHNTGQISLYLKANTPKSVIKQDLATAQRDQAIAKATYISPEQGLASFSKQSGFGGVLKDLHANPIPGVIEITPSPTLKQSWQIQTLFARVKKLPGVAHAQFDFQWLQRLQAILSISHRLATLLMIIFSVAVLLIIGNTIRLTTQNHRDEILVVKLIGGTNPFIRRPFLYSGFLYGLAGGIVAWFIIDFILSRLQEPVSTLASLYGNNYQLAGLNLHNTLLLLFGGGLLGLIGSWLAVNRYIATIEPN